LLGVEIVVSQRERSPFPVDAVVLEDDTYSVLGADPVVRPSTEHPIRVWTALQDVVAATPGSVIVRRGRPLRLLAVVHDLSAEPTWREEWIAEALREIVRTVDARRIRSLALPPLGAVHGRLPPERFASLLRAALDAGAPSTLVRIWIVAPAGLREPLDEAIAAAADPAGAAPP